ncbi:MAG: radical SAM protein, partial [Candidatus Brocadiales bacterium]
CGPTRCEFLTGRYGFRTGGLMNRSWAAPEGKGAKSADEYPVARMLKEAGCAIVKFGLESGSERIRREILHRPMTNEEIENAFGLAHKYGLHTSAFIMIGLPYEGKKEVMETVELLARIRPGRFRWSIFYPFPKTEAHELSQKGGYIDFDKMQSLENFTEASCLNFGQEHNLFISKLQRTFPWFVNRYSSNSVASLYTALTKTVEDMGAEAWRDFGEKVSAMDREISILLKKAHCEHYAFRYNTFTAVRSDWEE